MRYESPLRYPGGKARLAHFFKALYRANDLLEADYIEPYAGGASVALALLLSEYARKIHINDLSKPIYAFWHSALYDTEKLCSRISKARLDVREYKYQKAVLRAAENVDLLDLGFAAFYVNRTSRSGIVSPTAGAIGGNDQKGAWKLDARYNRAALIARIERIARHADRITLYNMDAEVLLRSVLPKLPERALVYLDPPYFHKGQRLYTNFYRPDDHAELATCVRDLKQRWVVSYDNVPEVRKLYRGEHRQVYRIAYTAANRYSGSEVLFFSSSLVAPKIPDPASFTETAFRVWLKKCHGHAA